MGLRRQRLISKAAAIDSDDDGLGRHPVGSYWDPRDLQTPRNQGSLCGRGSALIMSTVWSGPLAQAMVERVGALVAGGHGR
jgi:hypothetical protein